MAQTASRRATYDILRHYFHLEGSLEEIIQAMDMPENGIYVNTISHQSFDAFKWCLQPTDVRCLFRCYIHYLSFIVRSRTDTRSA